MTEDIIPTHKQPHIKEKLTTWNTKYMQIGRNTLEESTYQYKKNELPNENKKDKKKESPL